MITLYSGTPGAGKSLHLASRLYHWMQFRNAPIIGNFSCDFSSIKKPKGHFLNIDNSDLTPERLLWFSKNYSEYVGRKVKEGEILLVIDEAQLLFNSREWVKTDRAEWCAFFTQHRKLGYEVVLVAQFDRMLDRQIRRNGFIGKYQISVCKVKFYLCSAVASYLLLLKFGTH